MTKKLLCISIYKILNPRISLYIINHSYSKLNIHITYIMFILHINGMILVPFRSYKLILNILIVLFEFKN